MNQEPTIQDLFEMIVVIRDNAVTKDDLKNFATKDDLKALATKEDLRVLENKMEDGFSSMRAQLKSMEIELADIRAALDKIDNRSFEDTEALSQEVVVLRRRVDMLEQQMRYAQQKQPA